MSSTGESLFSYHVLYVMASSIFTRVRKKYMWTCWHFFSIYSSCGVRREIPDIQYPKVKTANNCPIFCSFLKARAGGLVFSFFYCGYNIIRLVFPLSVVASASPSSVTLFDGGAPCLQAFRAASSVYCVCMINIQWSQLFCSVLGSVM